MCESNVVGLWTPKLHSQPTLSPTPHPAIKSHFMCSYSVAQSSLE